MEQRISKKSLPSTVLQLYIGLYCKRRNYSKNKMMEAIKSWVTLTKCEKEQFKRLYEECQLSHKKKQADYLRKTQPYLKKRNLSRQNIKIKHVNETEDLEVESTNEEPINNDQENDQHEQNENNSLPIISNGQMDLPSMDMDVADTSHGDNTTLVPQQQISSCLNYEQYPVEVLAEPVLPSVRTARELFEIVKSRNGESTETWASLSSVQKSRYRKAVSLLKDDYLRKFKAYLESLPPKQLFNYYDSYFN